MSAEVKLKGLVKVPPFESTKDCANTFSKIDFRIELVSKELNHFGVIADLFRQIGGHSTVSFFESVHFLGGF